MLSVAKIELQNKLKSILKVAAYNAYMTQYQPNAIPEAQKYDEDDSLKKFQSKLADDFSEEFTNKATEPVTEAIYNFVKEIGIQITIPPSVIAPPAPPVLPGGPCTGVINITDIQIL